MWRVGNAASLPLSPTTLYPTQDYIITLFKPSIKLQFKFLLLLRMQDFKFTVLANAFIKCSVPKPAAS